MTYLPPSDAETDGTILSDEEMPDPQTLLPAEVVVPPKRVVDKIGPARKSKIDHIAKLRAQGKYIPPKKRYVQPGVVVAAPAWTGEGNAPGWYGDGDGADQEQAKRSSMKARDAALFGGGVDALKHAPALDVPLFVDRGADHHAQTQFGLSWWLFTAEGRLMFRLRIRRFFGKIHGAVVLTLMALFWQKHKVRVEGLFVKPATSGSLPKWLNRWWDFGLRLRAELFRAQQLIRHPHVGSWRRLLSMLWRRYHPARRREVAPRGWSTFRTPDGAYAAAGASLPTVTLQGVGLNDFIAAVGPERAIPAWLKMQHLAAHRPGIDRLTMMVTDLQMPMPDWAPHLAKLHPVLFCPTKPLDMVSFPNEVFEAAKTWLGEYFKIEDQWNELQRVKEARVTLSNALAEAVFISFGGRWNSFLPLSTTPLGFAAKKEGAIYSEFRKPWDGFAFAPGVLEIVRAFDSARHLLPEQELLKFIDHARTVGVAQEAIDLMSEGLVGKKSA